MACKHIRHSRGGRGKTGARSQGGMHACRLGPTPSRAHTAQTKMGQPVGRRAAASTPQHARPLNPREAREEPSQPTRGDKIMSKVYMFKV